jgi:hypothetical protein
MGEPQRGGVRWGDLEEQAPELAELIAAVRAAYGAPIQSGDEALFELRIERALLATYGPRPSWPPVYTRWPASP